MDPEQISHDCSCVLVSGVSAMPTPYGLHPPAVVSVTPNFQPQHSAMTPDRRHVDAANILALDYLQLPILE